MYWGDNMNIDTSNLLNSILEELSSLSYVHPGDVPNIDLYMGEEEVFQRAPAPSGLHLLF